MDREKDRPTPVGCEANEAAVRSAMARPDIADIVLQCLADGVQAAVAEDEARQQAVRAAE